MVLLLAGAPAPVVSNRPGKDVDEPPQENLPEFEVADPELSVQALY
jgi:hypothetical protein